MLPTPVFHDVSGGTLSHPALGWNGHVSLSAASWKRREKKRRQLEEVRMRRKMWEESLHMYVYQHVQGSVQLSAGTEVMYRDEAKQYYKLSDREVATLPYQQLLVSEELDPQMSPKSPRKRDVVPLESILTLVQHRFEAAGIPYPQNVPLLTMICNGKGEVYAKPSVWAFA